MFSNKIPHDKEYDQAILLRNQLLADSIRFSPRIENELDICSGYSYLETGNYQLAIDFFEKGLSSPESRIRVEARWYLALAYIKIDQQEKAIPYLKEIKSPEAGKSRIEAAETVLKQIR